MIEFRILGPLEVVQDEAPLALGGQKLRALLGLLVLHAGSVVSTDRLLDQITARAARLQIALQGSEQVTGHGHVAALHSVN